jgi:GNAT superfamily N-acetyltransferase
MAAFSIARAKPDEAARLTEIAHAAKRHWGYPDPWIRQWREALTLTPDYVTVNATFIALDRETIAGFSAVRFEAGEAWIDHLWVLPVAMGRGAGRQLFEACEAEATRGGSARLALEADSHAERFYRRMGAQTTGRKPAFMDGCERYLVRMEKALAVRVV